MTARLLETFFRHKRLILLPPLLIPLLAGLVAWLAAPRFYESSMGIWVERAAYLRQEERNLYSSPAKDQADRLWELLRTRTFVTDIAKRTALAPLAGSARGEDTLMDVIGRNISVVPGSGNLLVLRYRAATPELANQMLTAVYDVFKDRVLNDRSGQANLAISFYEARLQEAEQQYATLSDQFRLQLAANPRLRSLQANRDPSTSAAQRDLALQAADPQLADLQRRLDFQQREVERSRTSLEQARLDIASSLEGQELGLQVIDPASMPATPGSRERGSDRRRLLMYPAGGLLAGLGLSAILLVLLVAADRTIRSEGDLAPGCRLVGIVPRLHAKRLPRHADPDATRRAIAATARLALPAATEAH